MFVSVQAGALRRRPRRRGRRPRAAARAREGPVSARLGAAEPARRLEERRTPTIDFPKNCFFQEDARAKITWKKFPKRNEILLES